MINPKWMKNNANFRENPTQKNLIGFIVVHGIQNIHRFTRYYFMRTNIDFYRFRISIYSNSMFKVRIESERFREMLTRRSMKIELRNIWF